MAMSKTKMKKLEKAFKKAKKKVKKSQSSGDHNQAGMHMNTSGRIYSMIEQSLLSRP